MTREHDSDLLVLNDERCKLGVGIRCDVRAHLPSIEMSTMDYDRWLETHGTDWHAGVTKFVWFEPKKDMEEYTSVVKLKPQFRFYA